MAMQWAIRRGMGFKTLAACCEIFQNQPSDFLGAAVQCILANWYLKCFEIPQTLLKHFAAQNWQIVSSFEVAVGSWLAIWWPTWELAICMA